MVVRCGCALWLRVVIVVVVCVVVARCGSVLWLCFVVVCCGCLGGCVLCMRRCDCAFVIVCLWLCM